MMRMWIQLASGVAVGALFGRTPAESAIITGATIGTAAAIRRIGIMRVAQGSLAGLGRLAMVPSGYLAGAVVGGAIVGTGISYALFGKEGAKAAVDFYTNPLDIEKGKTLLAVPSNLAAITQGNRAVANNAAGLPTGTNVASIELQEQRGDVMSGDSWYTTPDSGTQGSWYSTPGG